MSYKFRVLAHVMSFTGRNVDTNNRKPRLFVSIGRMMQAVACSDMHLVRDIHFVSDMSYGRDIHLR